MRHFRHWSVVVARRRQISRARYRWMECFWYQNWSSETRTASRDSDQRLDLDLQYTNDASISIPPRLPPPVVVSGGGVNRVGGEGVAELGDGVTAPGEVGEGVIDPY
jgi:hypothetical protein